MDPHINSCNVAISEDGDVLAVEDGDGILKYGVQKSFIIPIIDATLFPLGHLTPSMKSTIARLAFVNYFPTTDNLFTNLRGVLDFSRYLSNSLFHTF